MNFSQALYEKYKLELLSDNFIKRGQDEFNSTIHGTLFIEFSIDSYPYDMDTPRDKATTEFIQIIDSIFEFFNLEPFYYRDNTDVSTLIEELNDKETGKLCDGTTYFDYRGGFFPDAYNNKKIYFINKALILAKIEYRMINESIDINIILDSESDYVISLLETKLEEELVKVKFEQKYPDISFDMY